jgi:hypothetical protein
VNTAAMPVAVANGGRAFDRRSRSNMEIVGLPYRE